MGWIQILRKKLDAHYLIPSECYSLGFPWTPHVWGSMFTGRIEKYPNSFLIRKDREKTFWMDQIRIPIRQFIKNKVGISWKRKGLSVNTSQEREEEKLEFNNTDIGIFKWLPPVINDSIFHKNHSYTYMIPAISDGYLYG